MANWKRRERQVAAYFGTNRTPLSGGNSGITRADTLHPTLFVENKHRKAHSVVKLWDQVKTLAKREGKTPVVTLTQHNRPGFWLVIHSDDLEAVNNARVTIPKPQDAPRNVSEVKTANHTGGAK